MYSKETSEGLWSHHGRYKNTRNTGMTLLSSLNRINVRRNLSSAVTLLFICWVFIKLAVPVRY